MLYHSDGGPGPATKLLRVDAPTHGRTKPGEWERARAARWTPRAGWQLYPLVQTEIRGTGELFLIDESEVPRVQQELRDGYGR